VPAILPARLRIQSLEVARLYQEPDRCLTALVDLLSRYADWSYRPGEVNAKRTLLQTYNVPVQVIRQIASSILEIADQNYQPVVTLCNTFWETKNYECCLLAGKLIGQMASIPDAVILETLLKWQLYTVDIEVQRRILDSSLSRIISKNPMQIIDLSDQFLHSADFRQIKTGLFLLERVVNKTGFDNTPVVFRRISPLLRQAPIELRSALYSLLEKLAINFPQETAYALSESLNASDNPDTHLLIRQVLDQLPPNVQTRLRNAIQAVK
jgi:hypothetical protein